ncbi:sulfite exporter TauE/SafE family protein [Melioribacteraceae bacterium 4301-Me]|uniref:sulfite exporter TauE/SafE family protein n=1 Tax=Pyranulibacter aquaticus TaxID=3163344 RepID=UPI0035980CEF
MNNIIFTVFVYIGSLLAGFLGSLTGLGGGIIIVPMLTLLFGVDIHYAVGASLIAVIATSSGAASTYVKEGYTNIRIGMFLEIATTIGAIIGAYFAGFAPANIIAVVFGIVLIYSAIQSFISRKEDSLIISENKIASKLKLNGYYPQKNEWKKYSMQRVPLGFSICVLAGFLSGLLGIGGGAVKVIAMDRIMKIPFKVSTTTSNFMIGVTAAASAGIYLKNGFINPPLIMPVLLGVLTGAFIGASILGRTSSKWLKILFGILVLSLAFEMIKNAISGNL